MNTFVCLQHQPKTLSQSDSQFFLVVKVVFSEHLTLTSIWLVPSVSQSTGIGGTWVGQVLRIGSPGVGGALGPSAWLSPLWKDPHASAPRQVFKIMWQLPLPFQLLS